MGKRKKEWKRRGAVINGKQNKFVYCTPYT